MDLTKDDAEYLTRYLKIAEEFLGRNLSLGSAKQGLDDLNAEFKGKIENLRMTIPGSRLAKNFDDAGLDYDDPDYEKNYDADAWVPSRVCY